MKKFLFLIIIITTSCVPNSIDNNFSKDSNFNDQMTFDEFKLELDEYAVNKPFPNIDD
jgi:hypothetical protein